MEGDGLAVRVVQVLRGSERFRCLHFAPFGSLNSSSMASVLSVVTSLEIRFDHLMPIPGNDSVPMDRCYEIFCLPTLRSLSIVGVRSWSPDESVAEASNGNISRSRCKTSNIASLSLLATVPPGSDLAELLSWPISLQSLHYELATDEDDSFGFGMPTLSPLDFSTALSSQMMCLEELIVYGDCQGDNKGYMATEVFDLRPFVNLRVVGLDIGYLMVTKLDAECADAEVGDFPAMEELMPPALDHLQIQINEYSFVRWFADVPRSEMGVVGGEVSDALIGLVGGECGLGRGLRNLWLWQLKDCATVETSLTGIEGCGELLASAERAGVEVSGWIGGEPTAFQMKGGFAASPDRCSMQKK
ncbi:hypothetical protein DL98DRAFT_532689 [Cadophora sp. DSE1049]|nr:hypothetical protein DL98DRAFT_532689 [Cadophora sp. DSE1049]